MLTITIIIVYNSVYLIIHYDMVNYILSNFLFLHVCMFMFYFIFLLIRVKSCNMC